MSTEIIWDIRTLDRNVSDGFVTRAHWICTGVNGNYTDSVYASINFDGELVTPYGELTKDQVLEWVWERLSKSATEAAVLSKIESQKNPVTASGVPWGS